VIHTVGPFWSGGQRHEAETLTNCHRESIRIADELQLASIAFPAISTGAYRYPVEQAAQVAVSSAAGALEETAHLREVRFVLFDGERWSVMQKLRGCWTSRQCEQGVRCCLSEKQFPRWPRGLLGMTKVNALSARLKSCVRTVPSYGTRLLLSTLPRTPLRSVLANCASTPSGFFFVSHTPPPKIKLSSHADSEVVPCYKALQGRLFQRPVKA